MKKYIFISLFAIATVLTVTSCKSRKYEHVGDKAAALINQYAQTIEQAEVLDSLSIDKVAFETQMNEFRKQLREMEESDPEMAKREKAKIDAADEHLQEVITKKICDIYSINLYETDEELNATDIMRSPEE